MYEVKHGLKPRMSHAVTDCCVVHAHMQMMFRPSNVFAMHQVEDR